MEQGLGVNLFSLLNVNGFFKKVIEEVENLIVSGKTMSKFNLGLMVEGDRVMKEVWWD